MKRFFRRIFYRGGFQAFPGQSGQKRAAQEPMGGKRNPRARSALSAWTRKRDLNLRTGSVKESLEDAHAHFQPFTWIVSPLNVLQTAVHFAQARSDQQAVVVLPRELLRINHYVDFGSNSSRCLEELGGCDVVDDAIAWAEDTVVEMREQRS
eukprot:TRINITY_DN28590_c0_g1_i1.p1 TRINITY_DN28590_c0_g1~~TRINITY_DN28590_c0_g1_i1.p1  ORF type:complete len:167 (+),score=31.75 TRINITY_DN28590_c0_g1_i1:48-503(+)